MGKVLVESIEGWPENPVWRRKEHTLRESRRGNAFFEFYPEDGEKFPVVIKDWKLDSPVVGLRDGKWVNVGRIARGPGGHCVFIGVGPSFADYTRAMFLRDVAEGKHPGFELNERRSKELEELEHLISQEELRESEPRSRW